MKLIWQYFPRYWWKILIAVGMTAVSVWATLQLPNIMAEIVNNGIMANDLNYVMLHGLTMLGVTAIGGMASIIVGYYASRVSTDLAQDVRKRVFDRVESFSLHEINKFSTASLITRTTNDVQQIQQFVYMLLRIAIQEPLIAVGAIMNALHTATNMSWLMALAIAALMGLVIFMFTAVVPKFKVQQKLVDKIVLTSRENLMGLRVIRAFNKESHEEKKFDVVNKELTGVALWINRATNILQPAMTLIISFTMLGIVWIGAHYVANSQLEIGGMMAFMQYAMQVIMSFLFLVMLMVVMPRAQVSASRINEVLTTSSTITPPQKPEPLDSSQRGMVEFKKVTFSYPGAESPVLNNINFTAQPGQTTAIIGSTGSGKSSLINLIPRLYDVSSGQVLVGGVDVRQLTPDSIVEAIGFVPQKGVLFSGTVASNIKYANPKMSDQTMCRYAKIAQADFIKDLDGSYSAPIAQGGSNVSGGQKQRLSIARALAKNPDILIFDDSFSALDYKTDAQLRIELAKIATNKTIIIVAQRISTIRHADQIIVLDNGEISGIGTHHELLRTNQVYQEIARSQFSDQEIEREMQEANHE